jgi:hypothetical protein
MNRQCKIGLHDTMMDVVMKMSEGNPGALTCLMDIMQKQDWYGGADSLTMVLSFDILGLYGSKLYILWNDCCYRNLDKLELVMRNWQMGNLSEQDIYNNVSNVRGTPFTNLKSLEGLFSANY